MTIHVQINITDGEGPLGQREQDVLAALAGRGAPQTVAEVARVAETAAKPETTPEPPAAEEKPKPAPRRRAAAKPEPTPEPEPEAPAEDDDEDLVGGDGPTLQDAIDKAQSMMAAGKAADVKAALAEIGVKKVSLLEGDQIQQFLDAV